MRDVGLKRKQAMHFPWLRFVPHRKILFKKHALHYTKQAVYPSSSLNVLPPHIANMWHMLRVEILYYIYKLERSFRWLELGSFTERSQNMWLKLVRLITNRVNLNRYQAARERLGSFTALHRVGEKRKMEGIYRRDGERHIRHQSCQSLLLFGWVGTKMKGKKGVINNFLKKDKSNVDQMPNYSKPLVKNIVHWKSLQ